MHTDNVVYGMNNLEDSYIHQQHSGEQEASMYEVPVSSKVEHKGSTIRENECVLNASSSTGSNVYATLGPNGEQVHVYI